MNKSDLSWKEDLSCGVQNLVNLEEHLEQSYMSTKKEKFLEILNHIRIIRTNWMQIIFDEKEGSSKQFFEDTGDLIGMYYWILENLKEGQFWCISKHLLASSMRGQEVGTKFLEIENLEKKDGFFNNILNKLGGKNG